MAGFEKQDTGGITFTPQQSQRQSARKRRASGLMKAVIDSGQIVKHPVDGKLRQHVVRDMALYTDAKSRLLCITCCKFFADAKELAKDARHEQKLMEKNNEAHVVALWSDDYPKDYLEEFAEMQENHRIAQAEEDERGKKGRKLKPPVLDPGKCIGLMTDMLAPR